MNAAHEVRASVHSSDVRNVTTSLDEETSRWIRVEAARDDMSVLRWVGELLRREREQGDTYEESMRSFLDGDGVARTPLADERGTRERPGVERVLRKRHVEDEGRFGGRRGPGGCGEAALVEPLPVDAALVRAGWAKQGKYGSRGEIL